MARKIKLRSDTGVYRTEAQSVQMKVTRRQTNWAYFYIFLGFALSLEASIVAFVEPLRWPWNLVTFLMTSGVTVYLVLFNAWFQNKLLGWKASYEDKAR